VIIRQLASTNNGILEGNDPALDSTNTANDSELKNEVEEWKFHKLAKVHDFLVI
jgi:hypothetical protein